MQMCLCEMLVTLFLTFILTYRAITYVEYGTTALEYYPFLKTLHRFNALILVHHKYLEQNAFYVSWNVCIKVMHW